MTCRFLLAAASLWTVIDPALIPVQPLQHVEVTFTPGDDWNFMLPDPVAYNCTGNILSSGSASSELNPLVNLFDWTISADTSAPGTVQVAFNRNGAPDPVTAAAIASRFSYNSSTFTYSFNNSGFNIVETLEVPSSYTGSTLEVNTQSSEVGTANALPEPAGLALLGILGTMGSMRRR